jgi:RyR domain
MENPVAIAMVAHETNRAYCRSIGDHSQVAWEDAPEWQKTSAIKGVQDLIVNPLMEPRLVHERWCEEKYRTGWSYGPVKDAKAKTHPCLVPYPNLSAQQQMKDRLFRGVVLTMAFPSVVVV